MKTPHLLASFAVAATASAAELKDPAEVARQWNEATAQPLPTLSEMPNLLDRPIDLKPVPRAPELPFFPPKRTPSPFQVPPWSKPPPKHPGTDIPEEAAPAGPDGKMPRGAKEWKYGGQTYWLMPLIPSRPD